MGIRVTHDLHDFSRDLQGMAARATPTIARAVQDEARLGNALARGFAKQSAGKHGKLYHRAFGFERTGVLEWEYGPDSEMPQGGMSFERGSRNQPYHGDLAKSADIIAERFGGAVLNEADGLFWSES